MTTEKKQDQAVAIEEWAHSPLGPSAAERWMHCPGSVLATKDLKDKPSKYATEGTAAHTVTEWCRLQGKRAEEFLGVKVKVPEGDQEFIVEVDQEMVDAVNYFLDYVDTFNGEMMVEERVSYTAWVPGGFGTSDDMRVSAPVCVVTDFKYGKGIQVYAHNNPQLKLYALGWFHDFGWMYPDVDRFQLNICQPRLDHVDEFHITLAELLEWANNEVAPAAERAMTPGAPYAAGDHCQWCLIKNECRTRAKTIFDSIVCDFDELDADTPEETVDPNRLALDEIGLMLPFLPMIKKFCNDLEAHALSELGKGMVITHPVTGDYKIVAGRSTRCYKQLVPRGEDNDAAIVKRLKSNRVPASLFYKKSLISIAQLEKALGKTHHLVVELADKPPGKPKLAPGTDKRPAITIDPDTEFDDVSDTED